MEPLSISLLAGAIATAVNAAAGEAGKRAWQRLTDMLRERFGKAEPTGSPEEVARLLLKFAERNPVLAESIQEFCFKVGVAAAVATGDPLPPDPPRYVNRRAELDDLAGAVEAAHREGRAAMKLLLGTPGVGTSALAVRFARERSSAFPGGRIRVDLREASLLDTFGILLRWQGVPKEFVEQTLQQRARQLRVSTTKAVCIIAEGVTEPRQLDELMPNAAGSMLIATMSPRPGTEKADWPPPFIVPPLTERHSAEMLSALVDSARLTADPDGTARLIALGGGLAQALRIAGSLLARRPAWTPTRLADHLFARGATEFNGIFDAAYAALTEPARRAYPMICVMPGGDFTVEALAAAAGMPLAQADEALVELADVQLVTDLGMRYHAGLLVRAHARARCAYREAALKRLIEWYVKAAYGADAAVMGERLRVGPGAMAAGGIGWLIAEKDNILWVMREAANTDCDDAVWQLAEACWALVFDVKLYTFWRRSGELGLAAAQRAGNAAAHVRMLQQLARLHLELGEFAEADARLAAATELADAIPERNRASLMEFVGILRGRQGRWEEALVLFDEAFALHDSAGAERRRGRAILLNQKGDVLIRLGRAAEAEVALTQALRLLGEIGDERTSVRTLLLRGRLPGREADLSRALELATARGLTAYRADALTALGRDEQAQALRARFGVTS